VARLHGAGSQVPWLSLNTNHPPLDLRPRSNNPNRFSKINSWPWFQNGRSTDFFLTCRCQHEQRRGGAMAGEGRAQTRGIRHQPWCSFFLRDLRDERNPFCILTLVKTDGGRLATAVRFGWPLAAVTGSSNDPPAIRKGWTDSSRSPPAPPCFNFSRRRRIELARQEILGG
jgi:hypothetical protein